MLNTAAIPKLIMLDEVDSTNNYAAKLLGEQKLTNGTVILAEKQTAGRGQRGNSWNSRENQFTASFYLETAFLSAVYLPFLNFSIALAVRNVIAAVSGMQTKIKWPNDILINDRKLSGILIEAQWQGPNMKGVIIGIGINLTEEEGLNSAVSLDTFCKPPSTSQLALMIWEQLMQHCELLVQRRTDRLSMRYHEHLWRKDVQQQALLPNGTTINGYIRGVNDQGDLRFESEGMEKGYGLQEIKFSY